ncbi:MAG TPA: GntR family transcriptional regulator [Oscillospiraceae bacterium]|nr:GntR family transcriptional regulator [Oscillospiraceae bacterium]
MDIIISNSGAMPIYEQIQNQIKRLILTGALGEGEALPSMRLLAKELRISLITTKRAYEELEREGFVTTVPGKGSFVAARNPELVREEHLRQTEEHLQRAVAEARFGGLSLAELQELVGYLYTEDGKA